MKSSKMLATLAVIVFLTPAIWAKSQTVVKPLVNSDEAKALVDRALSTMEQSGVAPGLRLIKPRSLFLTDTMINQWVPDMTNRRKSFEAVNGKISGHVLAKEQTVADTFLRLTYIETADKSVIRWVFTFYKPHDTGWVLYSFSWDSEIEPLFVLPS